jgi:hypothetical protein
VSRRTPTRRGVLVAAAAAPAALATAAAVVSMPAAGRPRPADPHPEWYAEWRCLWMEIEKQEIAGVKDEETESLYTEAERLESRILETPSNTVQGMRAKLWCLAHIMLSRDEMRGGPQALSALVTSDTHDMQKAYLASLLLDADGIAAALSSENRAAS